MTFDWSFVVRGGLQEVFYCWEVYQVSPRIKYPQYVFYGLCLFSAENRPYQVFINSRPWICLSGYNSLNRYSDRRNITGTNKKLAKGLL